MAPIVNTLETIAKFGEQIGKISASGKRTYMAVAQDGRKVYTTFDEKLNLLFQKMVQETQYGHKTEVFNKKDQLIKEYNFVRRANGELQYRELSINTYGGVLNSQIIRKEKRIMSYKMDAVKYPYIDMANYDSKIGGYKLASLNLQTNRKAVCENNSRYGGYDPYNQTPNGFLGKYGFKYV